MHVKETPADVQFFADPATIELSEPNAPDPARDPYRYLPLYLSVGTWPHEEDWVSCHKSSRAIVTLTHVCRYWRVTLLDADGRGGTYCLAKNNGRSFPPSAKLTDRKRTTATGRDSRRIRVL